MTYKCMTITINLFLYSAETQAGQGKKKLTNVDSL